MSWGILPSTGQAVTHPLCSFPLLSSPLCLCIFLALFSSAHSQRRQEGHFKKSHLENTVQMEKDLVACLAGSMGSSGMRIWWSS